VNVLVVSTLYPNAAQPVHAVFVEQRIRALARHASVMVLCPIPWFPFAGRLGRYAHRKDIPQRELRHGIEVHYPRFLSFPKILKPLDGLFLFAACRQAVRRLPRAFAIDRVDAHLAYPDGWGAILLGRSLDRPVSVTLRGHDLNDLPSYPVRGRQVAWTLRRADVVFAVAEALREEAIRLGADPRKTITIGNGIDTSLFSPQDQLAARRKLGLSESAPLVLSVGHLVRRKGFDRLIRAFPRVLAAHPTARLAIVGAKGEEGDFTKEIERAIRECRLEDRVHLPGAVPHDALAPWYAAADLFCLASKKEGRANVLLEAMACGTPIVATSIWGTPEIVRDESLGILVDDANPEALGAAMAQALSKSWDRDRIAESAKRFDWNETARQILSAWNGS
jgi:glycosyltransferase involved in cell wall biosynthesis